MVLLNVIPSDAKDETPVVLQSPDGARCKYLGALRSNIRKDVEATERVTMSVLGNKDSESDAPFLSATIEPLIY